MSGHSVIEIYITMHMISMVIHLNSVRFFETKEVKDSSGKLILPKGKVVDSNFTIPNPTNPSATLNPVVGISNFVYETRLNEEKRNINILRKNIYNNS